MADIGGYLGLFLGLSVFSLFEILELVLEKIEKKEEDKQGRGRSEGEANRGLENDSVEIEFSQKNR